MVTLEISLERFAEEVQRRMPGETAYVRSTSSGVVITAARPEKALVLRAVSGRARPEIESFLKAAGLTVAPGGWSAGEVEIEEQTLEGVYVAAVSYRSRESTPGVWMDAYPSEPTVQEVLTNMYREFDQNGEIADVSFEDFMRLAHLNVVILKPEELRYHVNQKVD